MNLRRITYGLKIIITQPPLRSLFNHLTFSRFSSVHSFIPLQLRCPPTGLGFIDTMWFRRSDQRLFFWSTLPMVFYFNQSDNSQMISKIIEMYFSRLRLNFGLLPKNCWLILSSQRPTTSRHWRRSSEPQNANSENHWFNNIKKN